MNISTLILTHNEAAALPACLASVAWCDDVLVLDSGSSDGTRDLARAHGARVLERPFDTFAGQRNFGVESGGLRHDWVLHLDADETVPSDLRAEMEQRTAAEAVDAYRMPSRMMFRGRWLRHAGMYPTYQVRLGRRSVLRFKQVGHGQRETTPPERLGTLRNALIHDSFAKGLEDWFQRHNRYSTQEAVEARALLAAGRPDWAGLLAATDPMRRRRALKQVAARLPCRPQLRFFYMYVLRRGFLDGAPGYTYCRLLALYEQMIVLKMRALEPPR